MLEHALKYARQGFKIFPVASNKKPFPGGHGFKDATSDEAQIKQWWTKYPKANIGLALTKESGICALDKDPRNGGDETFCKLIETYGPLPKTVEAVTGGDGSHNLFIYDERFNLPLQFREKGLDVIKNGYIIIDPSVHKSGKRYQWIKGRVLGEFKLAALPKFLLCGDQQNKTPLKELYKGAPEGSRHGALIRLTGSLIHDGLPLDEVIQFAHTWNQNNNPPEDDNEIERVVKSIWDKDQNSRGESGPYNDIFNAELFVSMHKEYLLSCADLGGWFLWNGHKWGNISQEGIKKYAIETVKELEKTPNDTDAFSKHVKASGMDPKLNAMLHVAKSMLAVNADIFDHDENLLNCKNGYVNLDTGKLLPPSRDKFFTKSTGCEYDPKAVCPQWLKFLDTIFEDNEELIEFIQLAIGYALTGSIKEQAFFILYGAGQNGKSTLIETLKVIFGDYCCHLPTQSLILKNFNSGSNDLARLKGSRFVTAVESGHSNKLDEQLIKRLTGGDTISARFLYHEFIDFEPTFKIFLATNHKPIIAGTDFGIWRRIKLVPFNFQIPDAIKDGNLKEKLKLEAPGILRWAIEGATKWNLFGLSYPQCVRCAVDEYQKEEDWIGQVIEGHFLIGEGHTTTSAKLLETINSYRGVNLPIDSKDLKSYLIQKGFKWAKATSGVDKGSIVWFGICPRSGDFPVVSVLE